jgi:hypothetical protein
VTFSAPIAGAWLALGASALAVAQTPATLDLSTKAIVAAASAYVDGYGTAMQNVLADETATQRLVFRGPVHEQTRTTKADLFITFLPTESVWIAVRDVREVDGATIDDPNNIRVLMTHTPLARLGAVIARKNSQFNIGNISRTFNEPTLALLIMTSKHKARFKFDRVSVTSEASPHVTISFKEKDRPTLITGINGAPIYTSGTLVIDASTGRIESTRLKLRTGSVDASIETIYGNNARLKLWVPVSMIESYEQSATGFEQTVNCVSTYSNYRKFETSAIIK